MPINSPFAGRRAVIYRGSGQSNFNAGGMGRIAPPLRLATPDPVDPQHAFTLTGGPRFGGGRLLDPGQIAGLEELREKVSETPVSAAVRWLIAQDYAEGREPPVYVGFSHAASGQKLQAIDAGNPTFSNGEVLVEAAVAALRKGGAAEIIAPAAILDQGEADRSSTPLKSWTARAGKYRADTEMSVKRITGQALPHWLIPIQLAAPEGRVSVVGAWTALAQHDLMLQHPRVTIPCPAYFLRDDTSGITGVNFGMNGVHFTGPAHAVRGEYEAMAFREVMIANDDAMARGSDPSGLTINDVRTCLRLDLDRRRSDGAVFWLPFAPLPHRAERVVIDTETLPPASAGETEHILGWRKRAGSAGPLMSVSLTDEAIRLECASPGTADFVYAFDSLYPTGHPSETKWRSGAWGNLRTAGQRAHDSIAVPGLKLHHWLLTSRADFL